MGSLPACGRWMIKYPPTVLEKEKKHILVELASLGILHEEWMHSWNEPIWEGSIKKITPKFKKSMDEVREKSEDWKKVTTGKDKQDYVKLIIHEYERYKKLIDTQEEWQDMANSLPALDWDQQITTGEFEELRVCPMVENWGPKWQRERHRQEKKKKNKTAAVSLTDALQVRVPVVICLIFILHIE